VRIFADENIPLTTIQALRDQGHEVTDIRDTSDKGADDDRVWELAQEAKALLITTDKVFANLREEGHSGILIIRLRQPNWRKIHHRVMEAVRRVPPGGWAGLLLVMRDTVESRWKRR
jgi:predicted nuclease of predicted toxin-antitoxin system